VTRHTAALAVARGDLQHGGDSVSLTWARIKGRTFRRRKIRRGDLFRGTIIFRDTGLDASSSSNCGHIKKFDV